MGAIRQKRENRASKAKIEAQFVGIWASESTAETMRKAAEAKGLDLSAFFLEALEEKSARDRRSARSRRK